MGGQSIPLFDYYLAPYVGMSYIDILSRVISYKFDLESVQRKRLKAKLRTAFYRHKSVFETEVQLLFKTVVTDFLEETGEVINDKTVKRIGIAFKDAYENIDEEVYQSMEALVHNLCTMHSRAGRSTAMVEVPVTWETLCPAV